MGENAGGLRTPHGVKVSWWPVAESLMTDTVEKQVLPGMGTVFCPKHEKTTADPSSLRSSG
jgi:hypothetical protein